MTFNILKIKPKLPALPMKSCRIWPSLLLISLPAHPPDCAPSTLAFLLLLKHPRSCWRHWLLLFPGTLAFTSSQSQLLVIIQITNQLHCLSPAMTTELFCLPYPGYFSDNISNYLALLCLCIYCLSEYIMRNAGLEEAQAGIKIARRNISNLRYADDTTLMAESEEELKSLLMKVKVESEKVGLKLNIQKTKIMATGPITSWEIDGEAVSDFLFLGSKITADGDCSHGIKRCLLLGRKVMTNLDSIFKSRDITLPTKVRLVKAMVFPVVMYGCESWTVKTAERRGIDVFELWCWRRLLRVPWTARRSNQFILKEISPGCSLEGMMLKLKLQYFGHLM